MSDKNLYIPVNQQDPSKTFKSYGATGDHFKAVSRSTASFAYPVDSTVSIRPPFSNSDYGKFRPNEAIPCDISEIIIKCREIYIKSGMVRNVIDMMTDFIVEGLKIADIDKKNEAFFQVWMQKANVYDAVEEFARHMLIDCNVVVKRKMAKLTLPAQNEWEEEYAKSAEDIEKIKTSERQNKREIPWRYIFLNVAALEWIGDEIDQMSDDRKLVLRLSNSLKNKIKNIRGSGNKILDSERMRRMPANINDVLDSEKGTITVNLDKVYISYGKKDSWQDWAIPYLYSILFHVIFKEKLLQADSAAADGVINAIRIWKLGDHTKEILPSPTAFSKLANILESNTGGGSFDIIWDSLIDVKDIYPPIKDILGSEKYEQVDKDILIGLGVPEVLIGGRGGNFSNSYIQLKTLVEKLKYVRRKIIEWLQCELNFVKKAMDITSNPRVKFASNTFDDENITKKLIVGLLDRGVISVEAVLEAYGEDFLIEINRISDESKTLKKFSVEPKSPFDQPEQTKTGTPGRPSQTQDVNREKRKPKVRRADFELMTKGLSILDAIEEYVLPVYIQSCNVANARQLTNEQKEDFAKLRLTLLSMVKPEDEISQEYVISLLDKVKDADLKEVLYLHAKTKQSLSCIDKYTVYDQKLAEALAWSGNFDEV